MKSQTMAETNIRLCARSQDRDLIDQAAELVGASRSQFVLSSALTEARTILLDQTSIQADTKTFQTIMGWTDAAPSDLAAAGMARLSKAGANAPWRKTAGPRE